MSRSLIPVEFTLYLITDRGATAGRELLAAVEEALAGGVGGVQLREKGLSGRDYLGLAQAMRSLTARYGARLLVNDRIDVALAAGADGVHLPEAGLPVGTARGLLGKEKLVGASCHSLETARAAERAGADFITFGPVYQTPSKAAYGEPVGIAPLAEAVRELSIPVFPLGGVTRERVPELLAAGARCAACISALLTAPSPRAEAEAIRALLDKAP